MNLIEAKHACLVGHLGTEGWHFHHDHTSHGIQEGHIASAHRGEAYHTGEGMLMVHCFIVVISLPEKKKKKQLTKCSQNLSSRFPTR